MSVRILYKHENAVHYAFDREITLEELLGRVRRDLGESDLRHIHVHATDEFKVAHNEFVISFTRTNRRP